MTGRGEKVGEGTESCILYSLVCLRRLHFTLGEIKSRQRAVSGEITGSKVFTGPLGLLC